MNPFKIYGDGSGLYVGSYGNGQLWHYEPDLKKWTNLFKMELKEKQKRNIYKITKFNDRLLVSLVGYNDTTATGSILHMQPDDTWKNIALPDSSLDIYVGIYKTALYFTDVAEWHGKLFISSDECGIWVYDNVSWRQLPKKERDAPYVIEFHKDRLYVGQHITF